MEYYDICEKMPTKTCRIFCILATVFPSGLVTKKIRKIYKLKFDEDIKIGILSGSLTALEKRNILDNCSGIWTANIYQGCTPEHYANKFRRESIRA